MFFRLLRFYSTRVITPSSELTGWLLFGFFAGSCESVYCRKFCNIAICCYVCFCSNIIYSVQLWVMQERFSRSHRSQRRFVLPILATVKLCNTDLLYSLSTTRRKTDTMSETRFLTSRAEHGGGYLEATSPFFTALQVWEDTDWFPLTLSKACVLSCPVISYNLR